jgi:hypothetical protein
MSSSCARVRRWCASTVLLAAAVVGGAPARAATLEQGIKRETALLVAERDALQREQERIDVDHSARIAALRATVAALEARLVEEAAREEALRQAVVSSTQASAPAAAAPPPEQAEALALLGAAAPSRSDTNFTALDAALERLAQKTRWTVVDTGFFAADGTWLQGRVARLGTVAVAAADTAAGPLLSAREGAEQLAAVEAAFTDAARAVVASAGVASAGHASAGHASAGHASAGHASAGLAAATFVPLAWSDVSRLDEPTKVAPSWFARITNVGGPAWLLVAALVSAVVVIGVLLARRVAEARAVAAVVGRIVGLVAADEHAAAAALARTVPGAPGRFLVAVLAAAARPAPDDEVAALSIEVAFGLERAVIAARAVAVVAASLVIVTTAFVFAAAVDARGFAEAGADVLGPVLGALVPLTLGAVALVPGSLAYVALVVVVARLRERLDVVAVRILDAADHRR